MKYMLLIYGNNAAWSALDQQAIDRIGSTHKSIQRDLAASGELIDHKELVLDPARIVRSHDRDHAVTTGPLTHDGQILGGYYIVDCADLDRATCIARRFVETEFAPIEVRALSGDTTWDTGSPGQQTHT